MTRADVGCLDQALTGGSSQVEAGMSAQSNPEQRDGGQASASVKAKEAMNGGK